MEKLKAHWTERSTDDFLFRVASDFVRQVEGVMESRGIKQAQLAKRLHVSEARVSQVLNNPGNLTLRKMVEYARALGRKLAIVEYDDNDPANERGPISSAIFTKCWQRAGMPTDFFELEDGAPNVTEYRIVPDSSYFPFKFPISSKATNAIGGKSGSESFAGTDANEQMIQQVGAWNG